MVLASASVAGSRGQPAMLRESDAVTFKDAHPEIQHLVRELQLVRKNNLKFKEGDPQDTLLLFAEAALVCLALERFVRAVLGEDATEKDTLYNLLQKAVARGLLRVPWDDQQDGIAKISRVRNSLLHGSYEQAAREARCASVAEYFKTVFASEIEAMYKIADSIVAQIDRETGEPYPPRPDKSESPSGGPFVESSSPPYATERRMNRVPAVGVPEHIAARIRSVVASTPTEGGHIDNEAARYGGVALWGTIGAVWLLRPDGTLWEVDDDFGRPLAPLSPEWHHAALVSGAERHPWLADSIPPRPADARSCATCSGSGRFPLAGSSDLRGIFCTECHARGWHRPA